MHVADIHQAARTLIIVLISEQATLIMQVRDPMPPVHFFLIDVSHTAVTTGVTVAACNAIQQVLSSIQGAVLSIGLPRLALVHFQASAQDCMP